MSSGKVANVPKQRAISAASWPNQHLQSLGKIHWEQLQKAANLRLFCCMEEIGMELVAGCEVH